MSAGRIDDVLIATRDELLAINRGRPVVENYLRVHYSRYRYDIREILRLAAPGARILDLGAAPFCTAETLSRLGYDVVGVDVAPDNWGYVDRLSFPVRAANCDGEELPFKRNRFDVVVLTEVFEHLHIDLVATARQIRRVLKSGGSLYLTTPNGFGLRRLAKVLRTRRFQNVYEEWGSIRTQGFCGHVTEYTPRELEDFFTKCHFADVRARTVNIYHKQRLETRFWHAVTAALPGMRETIVMTARKPKGEGGKAAQAMRPPPPPPPLQFQGRD